MYDMYPSTSPYSERGASGLGHPYYPIDTAPRQPHERPTRELAQEYAQQAALRAAEVEVTEVPEQ